MKTKKTLTLRASAVSLAMISMLLTSSLNAGVINNSNPDTAPGAFLGDCGTVGAPTGCFGAWNLGNVQVSTTRALDGSVLGTFDSATGNYLPMTLGDSFASFISNGNSPTDFAASNLMARVTGKVWPVGEPSGIKAVNGDKGVTKGKPQNCLINTSFLSADDSKDPLAAYLDTAHPKPVICSSPFQSHKRFKIAMLPGTVAGVMPTAGGANEGKGIDMVFNVTEEIPGALRPYQVFSKINNYTGMRLKGYKIVVGTGTGDAFVPASEAVDGRPAINDKLHISLGVGEGATGSATNPTYNGNNLFDDDGLATFSHGLFGPPSDEHPEAFPTDGFFDGRLAGFNVEQTCSSVLPCSGYPGPYVSDPPAALLINSDTIYSTTLLPSNYASLFGDWLPSIWQPKGIFFDTDGDPTTDADLVAWWDGSAWRKNFASGFAVVSAAELNTWAGNKLYAVDDIEDVLNLGINYIVKVGDNLDGDNDPLTNPTSQITVRIIPIVADTQVAPAWMAAAAVAPPLVVDPTVVPVPPPTTPTTTVPSSGGGGGCTTATGDAPTDPVLPILAALGLIGLGVRRLRRQ